MNEMQIRNLLAVSADGADYLARTGGIRDDAAEDILANLRQIAALIEEETQEKEGVFHRIHLYAKNIQASIDDIHARPDCYERIVRMEIRPFVTEMRQLWLMEAEYFSSEEGRDTYAACLMEKMEELHNLTPVEHRYDVSILVLAYNKLEYTRCAVESLLAHTDFSRGNIQLVLLNNGSDDGTREYFESIPQAQVMNLRHNILGVFAYQHILEGKYFIGFSNDVVATPHWLENLLSCMQSDDRIAIAVPTCNEESIACFQGLPVSYPNTFEGMEAMQVFAAKHNQLNQRVWEDRSQLMPFLAIMRSDIICLRIFDPRYTRGEFIDDDMSTLLRRTGWRQILMKDTFMHHFGGVTLGAGRNKDTGNALDAMRRVYYEKWGVDAWESRGGFANMDVLWTQQHFRDDDRVLILEPCFGDLACSVVNAYRQHGCVPHMTAAVFDRRYLKDTSYIFDETRMISCVDDVKEDGHVYEIISTGRYLDELPSDEVISALECLYDCLSDGGRLILPVRNPSCADAVISLLYEGGRSLYAGIDEVRRTPVVSYRHLIKALERHEILRHYRMMAVAFQEDEAAAALLREFFSARARLPEDVDRNLSVRMVYLIFEKRGEPAKRMGQS